MDAVSTSHHCEYELALLIELTIVLKVLCIRQHTILGDENDAGYEYGVQPYQMSGLEYVLNVMKDTQRAEILMGSAISMTCQVHMACWAFFYCFLIISSSEKPLS